jgi:hypothetical protein
MLMFAIDRIHTRYLASNVSMIDARILTCAGACKNFLYVHNFSDAGLSRQ